MILVRVDDFPHYKRPSADFLRFDSLMKSNGLPYLLGVTPFPCLDPLNARSRRYRRLTEEEIGILHGLGDVELAMHGITHQTGHHGIWKTLMGFRSEFAELSDVDFGLSLFEEYGLPRPRFFIPPFNTFKAENFNVLARHFEKILGGPESPKLADPKLILSLPPYYGHAEDMKVPEDANPSVCLTFHWTWEANDDFTALKKICEKLKGRVSSWRQL